MEKVYYGLRVKESAVGRFDSVTKERFLSFNRLLAASLEFLGDIPYYHSDGPIPPFNHIWLVEGVETAENILSSPPEYEDDSTDYYNLFITYACEVNEVEVVKIEFSTDKNKFENNCVSFLNDEKIKDKEFLPLGWEAKKYDDDELEDEDLEPEKIYGPKLQCPMAIWKNKEQVNDGYGGKITELEEFENSFSLTTLSYKVTSI